MKELEGLKVEALAMVEKRKFNEFHIAYGNPTVLLGTWFTNKKTAYYVCDLPEGEWQILGRADEIANDIDALCKLFGSEDIHGNFFYWTCDVVTANNLTNELILIKK